MFQFFSFQCYFFGACSSSDLSLVEETEERHPNAKDFQSQGRYEDALITYLGLILSVESSRATLGSTYLLTNFKIQSEQFTILTLFGFSQNQKNHSS